MSYMIPKTLDNPIRALGVPIDTLIIFMGIWSAFVLFDSSLYGIPVGIVAAGLFSKFRNRAMIRRLIRFTYWYLPSEMNFMRGVKGHQRRLKCR